MKIEKGPINRELLKKHRRIQTKRTSTDGPQLDTEEQWIEDHLDEFVPVPNEAKLKKELRAAAKEYNAKKKPVTLRISERDLMMMKLKASKLGIPYQTYINMLIHHDALNSSSDIFQSGAAK